MDIGERTRPEASFTTGKVSTWYRKLAQELYQDWIKAGIIRPIQPDKKYNWIVLSKVITK